MLQNLKDKGNPTPYSAQLSEAKFQSRIIACAQHNGWIIQAEDAIEGQNPRLNYFLSRHFRKLTDAFKLLTTRRHARFSLIYHTHDSRNSQAGFPDLVLIHPMRSKIIFAELKKDNAYLKPEQRLWAAGIEAVAIDCPNNILYRCWRPRDWDAIVEELGGIDSRLFV